MLNHCSLFLIKQPIFITAVLQINDRERCPILDSECDKHFHDCHEGMIKTFVRNDTAYDTSNDAYILTVNSTYFMI